MGHGIGLLSIFGVLIVVLVLGLRFLSLYSRAHGTSDSAGDDLTVSGSDAAVDRRAVADSEAAAVRERAERDAEAVRRSAAVEADSLRRAAQAEVEAAQAAAETAKASAEFARQRAEVAAADLLVDARREAAEELRRQRVESDAASAEAQRRLAEAQAREQALAVTGQELAAREAALALKEVEAAELRNALVHERAEAERVQQLADLARVAELERIAGLSAEEARAELVASAVADARREAAAHIRKIEADARAEGTDRARAIVVDAIQRVASEQTSETVVSVLHLPSDEMKGRIIGREGRNIRTFESVTGVNVIIDDTPEAVLLSCFDPVRREVGRITLEKLVLDGRIHPHRIEEIYLTAQQEVDELCLRAAREALVEVGINDLDDRLIPTLGRLRYRTSYGQNVLGHLIETAHIAGAMASELGLDPTVVKRAAFLHDIGKAMTHEVEGSHAVIGAALLRKYGESETVAHAVEAHHNEVQPQTVEAVLTQAADACSAARPGARRESLETYIRRLERIEQIATAKHGVEKVFAMQAGREVRVMVLPNEVDDLAAGVIAREVAKQIEDELTYPGQIRVTVVRESRATEVAH
jgi:ribonuclease Y